GLPTPSQQFSYGWDVNARGAVSGEGFNSTGGYRAFKYDGTSTSADLGVLSGFGASEGYGINGGGAVVGKLEPITVPPAGTGDHAFLYANGVLQDLNGLIPSGTGWVLNEARAINDNGYVVGSATIGSQSPAFLLVPTGPTVSSI